MIFYCCDVSLYLFLSTGHIYRAQLLHGSGRPKAALDELLIASGQYYMWKWKWTLTLYWKHYIYLYWWSIWVLLRCLTSCCTALYVHVTSIWKKSLALTLFCSQPFLSNFLLGAFHSIYFIFLYSPLQQKFKNSLQRKFRRHQHRRNLHQRWSIIITTTTIIIIIMIIIYIIRVLVTAKIGTWNTRNGYLKK